MIFRPEYIGLRNEAIDRLKQVIDRKKAPPF
jgi:hypothetical protein